MTLADQHSPGQAVSLFDRAGLSRETVKAWLGSDDAPPSDYRQAVEKFSRRWRIGAELLASLPRKPARSEAQSAAAIAILERDRAARPMTKYAPPAAGLRKVTTSLSLLV